MIKKKTLIFLCLVGIVIFLISIFSRQIGLCSTLSYSSCGAFFDGLGEALLPIFPLFLFSIITYFMSEKVFQIWSRFAIVWIPISMILIGLAPEYGEGLWLFPRIEKGTVALVLSALFVAVSIILIAWTTLRTRKNEANKSLLRG